MRPPSFRSPIFSPLRGTICAVFIASFACAMPLSAWSQALDSVPRSVPIGTDTRPIQLDRVATQLRPNHVLGDYRDGAGCINVVRPLVLTGGGRVELDASVYEGIVGEVFNAAGLDVAGNPNALFQDPDADRAELLLGALVKDLTLEICGGGKSLFFVSDEERGSSTISVEWQVFDRLQRRVIYSVTTTGEAETEWRKAGGVDAVYEAFRQASYGLLADDGFFNVVARNDSEAEDQDVARPAILVENVDLSNRSFQDGLTLTRARVATVRAAGHGSGFFIADNYLLTNAHVVGGASLVTVRLVTGRELVGEVVATESVRDVALVRTEPSGLGGLPIRKTDPVVGDSVFVIGSPMDEELESTVSAGIISAFRSRDGLRYIQSDVNVLPGNSGGPMFDANGNVIAITVLAMFGVGSGLNLFIPIGEAMSTLNIQIEND